MIKRIVAVSIFFCLFLAVALSAMGYSRVELGGPFLAFLKNCNTELNSFKLQIPHIPELVSLDAVFHDVWQTLLFFLTGVIPLVNVIIDILNFIITILQFIFIMLKNLTTLKDSIQPYVPNP